MAVALDGEALEPRAGAGPLDADAGVGAEDRSVGGTEGSIILACAGTGAVLDPQLLTMRSHAPS